MMKSPAHILQTVFGHKEFRGRQEEVIESVLDGRDTLVVMPTGGGKSLCYQIPALCMPGLTIVVSPLLALMKDQVEALRARGVEAELISSAQSIEEQKRVVRRVESGRTELLYISPERVFADGFPEWLRKRSVSLVAVDEAHCIAQWGQDFRPDYAHLSVLRDELPTAPVIAWPATADAATREHIIERLHLRRPNVFVDSFHRPNIHHRVEPKRDTYGRIRAMIDTYAGQSGIIYTLSRASAEKLAQRLDADGISAVAYHAGLDAGTRGSRHEAFRRNEVSVVVATVAFGMGIDKPDVRFVIHHDLPKSMEAYYQESGRAGRDGAPCTSLLLYGPRDARTLRDFIDAEPDIDLARMQRHQLDAVVSYCESLTCRTQKPLAAFDEAFTPPCDTCDICREPRDTYDGTIDAQKVFSAIARTQERFGMNTIIDILTGAVTTRPEHKELKTFGVGRSTTRTRWRAIIKELVSKEYLMVSDGTYPVLGLSDAARDVLFSDDRVSLIADPSAERPTRRRTVRSSEAPKEAANEAANEALMETPNRAVSDQSRSSLFERLRAWRIQVARANDAPAFTVLSDATLLELARLKPRDLRELRAVQGFGEVKLRRHGDDVLRVIRTYDEEHPAQ
ncbi:MAG: DNA helicase RecQ [Candidatus Kapaibacterium sp.]